MSRSYKEPWIKDKCRFNQKLASRLLRRHRLDWDVADGMAYKRYYPQWDISDWCWPISPPTRTLWFYILGRLFTRTDEELAREWVRYKKHTGNRRAHRLRLRSSHHKGYCNEDQTDYTDRKASKAWATDVERGSEA